MISNPFSLHEKCILVTGASSGIGKSTAIECARMGANVYCTGRNSERLEHTCRCIEKDGIGQAFPIIADLNELEDKKHLVEMLPKLDGAVFSAGINNRGLISFLKETVMEDLINTNLYAPVFLTKTLLKKRKLANNSSLVYVSSVEGNNTHTISNSAYGMAKSALQSFVRTLALEVAEKGIRCNTVNPGRINTPLVSENNLFSDDIIEKDINNYPLKRYGEPQEVAYAVIYLLSDASRWVTGTSIVIDGGLTIK